MRAAPLPAACCAWTRAWTCGASRAAPVHYGIDGRSALIVGGSKGIGFEAAKLLAAEGARVAVLARTKSDVDAAVETIRSDGGTAIGVSADVGNAEQLGDAVREVTANHG